MINQEKLERLTVLKNEMDSYRPLDRKQLEALEQETKLEHVFNSNKIEGNTLSRNETEAIMRGVTVNEKSLKDTLEVVDLSEAYDYMQDLITTKQELNKTVIRDINRIVTYNTSKDRSEAGAFRAINVRPSSVPLADNPYADAVDVPFKVDELIDWSKENANKLHPVEYAAKLHYKFVTIHPFADGNGRTARLLMNFALSENGYPIVNLKGDEQQRNSYIDALEAGNKDGNMAPFVDYIADKTEETLVHRNEILARNEKNIEEAKKDTNLKLKSAIKKHSEIER